MEIKKICKYRRYKGVTAVRTGSSRRATMFIVVQMLATK